METYSIPTYQLPKNNVESFKTPQFSIEKNKLPTITTNIVKQNKYYNTYKPKQYAVEEKKDAVIKYSQYTDANNLYSDSKNATQVNSIVDAWSKAAYLNRQSGQTGTLSVLSYIKTLTGLGKSFSDSPLGEYYHRTLIDPMVAILLNKENSQSGWAALGINNLVAFGETVDLLANPIKSLLPKSWTSAKYDTTGKSDTVGQRLGRSFKWDNGGRYSYDIDFDFDGKDSGFNILEAIANLGGEILSDPINWFTFGSSALFKSGGKEVLSESVETFGKTYGDDILLELTDKESKHWIKEYLKASTAWDTTSFKKFTESFNGVLFDKLAKAGIDTTDLVEIIFNPKITKTIFEGVEEGITNKMSLRILRGVYSLFDKANTALNIVGAPAIFGSANIVKHFPDFAGLFAAHRTLDSAITEGLRTSGSGVILQKYSDGAKHYMKELESICKETGVDPTTIKELLESDLQDSIYKQTQDIMHILRDEKLSGEPDALVKALKEKIYEISGGEYTTIEEYAVNYIKLVKDENIVFNKVYNKESLVHVMESLVNVERGLKNAADASERLSIIITLQKDVDEVFSAFKVNEVSNNLFEAYKIFKKEGRVPNKGSIADAIDNYMSQFNGRKSTDLALEKLFKNKKLLNQFKVYLGYEGLYDPISGYWDNIDWAYTIRNWLSATREFNIYVPAMGIVKESPIAINNLNDDILYTFFYGTDLDLNTITKAMRDKMLSVVFSEDKINNYLKYTSNNPFGTIGKIHRTSQALQSYLPSYTKYNHALGLEFEAIKQNPIYIKDIDLHTSVNEYLTAMPAKLYSIKSSIDSLKDFGSENLEEAREVLSKALDDMLELNTYADIVRNNLGNSLNRFLYYDFKASDAVASIYKHDEKLYDSLLDTLLKSNLARNYGKTNLTEIQLNNIQKDVKDVVDALIKDDNISIFKNNYFKLDVKRKEHIDELIDILFSKESNKTLTDKYTDVVDDAITSRVKYFISLHPEDGIKTYSQAQAAITQVDELIIQPMIYGLEENHENELIGILLKYQNDLYKTAKDMKVIAAAEETLIRLRIERSAQTVNMCFSEFSDRLYEFNTPGGKLDQLIATYKTSNVALADKLEALKERINVMQTQRDMILIAEQYFPNAPIFTSVMESLSKYMDLTPEEFITDRTIGSIINSIKINLGYKYFVRGLSLDEFRNQMKGNEFLKIAKETFGDLSDIELKRAIEFGHTDPGGDLVASILVSLTQDKENYTRLLRTLTKDHYGLWIDIETGMRAITEDGYVMNSNPDITPITQVALRDPLTNENFILRLKDVTDPTPLSGTVIYCKSEKDLLTQLDNVLSARNIHYYLGYNCDEFDLPYIAKRMQINNMHNSYYSELFNSKKDFYIYDGLLAVRRNAKIPSLDSTAIDNLKDYMYRYAQVMYDESANKMQQIAPKKLRMILEDIQSNYKNISSATTNLEDSEFKVFDNILETTEDEYKQLRESIDNLLQHYEAYEQNITNKEFNMLLMQDISKDSEKWNILYEQVTVVPNTSWSKYKGDFEGFKKAVQEHMGREDFSTMQHLWTPYGQSSDIMFQYLYRGGDVRSGDFSKRVSKYLGDNGLTKDDLMRLPRTTKTLSGDKYVELSPYQLMFETNNDKAIVNLYQKKIKFIKGIYHISFKDANGKYRLLFKDAEDLFKQTDDLVANARADSWLKTINLKAPIYRTEAGRFALWYRNFTLGINKNTTDLLSKDLKATIEQNIINTINRRVFFTTSNSVHKFADNMAAVTYDDLIHSSAYDALDELDRMSAYHMITAYLPSSDTKSITRLAQEQGIRNFITWLDSLPVTSNRAVYNYLNKVQDTLLLDRSLSTLNRAFNNPEEFIAELLTAGGVRFFSYNPMTLNKGYKAYGAALEKLYNDSERLDKLGIKVFKGSDGYGDGVYEFVLDKNKGFSYDPNLDIYMFNGKEYKGFEYTPISFTKEESNIEGFIEHLNTLDEISRYAKEKGDYTGLGWSLNKHNVDQLYFSNISKEMQEFAITPQMLNESKWFSRNRYFIADTSPLEMRNRMFSHPGNPVTNVFKAYNRALNSIEAKDLFMDYLCNPKHGMSFAEDGFFKGLTDDKIVQMFKDYDDLIVVVPIKADNTQGYLLKQLKIYSVKDVQAARKLGASIVDYQTYSTMFDAINNNGDAVLKNSPDWLRTINYIYKLGYLASPGTWLRNVFDSNLKAMLDTGDPDAILSNTIKADRLYRQYDNTIKLMSDSFDLSKNNMNVTYIKKFYSDDAIQKMLASKKCIDNFEEFMDMHNFINYGPSAGYSHSVKKLLGQEESNILYYVGSRMLTPMSYIESRVRLTQYLTLKDQGYLTSDIFKKVSQTAFDYGIRTEADKTIELFIPFFTFQKLNFLYWIDKMCNNPVATKLIFEMNQTAQNSFEFTPEEYQQNQSLRYYLENGGVNLGGNAVLKMNPSYLDAYNLLCDPVNGILGSTWAPLKPVFKEVKEIIPSLFASGLNFTGETAANHFRNICEAIFEDPNSYPWYGVFYQRYFAKDDPNTLSNEDSTARKNYKRIEDDMFKKLGAAFPDIFGSVNRWNNYKWNENLPDRNTDPEKYYKELKRRAATKEFQDMYTRMKSNPNPSEKQQKFLAWIESTYFPYASKKQKDYFESGRYKQYSSGVRKNLYSSNYQYNKDKYPSRNRNYYRESPRFRTSTFWKVYNQAKAHAYYGWSVRIGSQYLNFNYFSPRY